MNRTAKTLAALLVALGCSSARAHLEATGMGPLYDGLLHFLTSPADLASALALALLAGLRGAAHGRCALFVLPAAWLLGGLGGLNAAASAGSALGTALTLLALGALVVADVKLSLRSLGALAALLGLVHGYFNGSGMGVSVASVIAALGVAAAVFVLVALVTAFVATLCAHWARIAVRVGGSWIAASGLLLLGWSLRAAVA